MKSKIPVIKLVLILFLAFFLRVFSISTVPPAVSWDEAAVGYNAYSILKTGRDEHGLFLPLTFRSFDDYKPPVFVYLLVPWVKVFGLNEKTIRLPSAIIGVLTIITIYSFATLWGKDIFVQKKSRQNFSLLTAFLLSISSWHLQFSRVAFEPNAALLFVVLSLFFLFASIKKSSKSKCLLMGLVLGLVSIYTYHSAKIFFPVFLLLFVLKFRKFLDSTRITTMVLLVVLGIFPLVWYSFAEKGLNRFANTTFFEHPGIIEEINRGRGEHQESPIGLILHNKPVKYFSVFWENYLKHFSTTFLFTGSFLNYRLDTKEFGKLYFLDFPFFLAAIFALLFVNYKFKSFMIFWLLVSPFPAALGLETPHGLRAFNMLPILILLIAMAIIKSKISLKLIFILYLLSFFFFFHYYLIHYPKSSSFDWQYGHKQMVDFVTKVRKPSQKLIVTTQYQQPYIFFLFYGMYDPKSYQKNGLDNIEFRRIEWKDDKKLSEVFLVAPPEEIPAHVPILKGIKFLDGSLAFKIVSL